MTLEQLHERIKAGRYPNSAAIYDEEGTGGKRIYVVYDNAPPPTASRILIDTVAGYKARFGL